MKRVWVVVFFLLVPAVLWAQQNTISTIAGGGPPGWPLITAIAKDTPVAPRSLATDTAGNVYFSTTFGEDFEASLVFKLSPNGVMTPVAGTGSPGYSGDGGAATSAQLSDACGLAVDSNGNLYIADAGTDRVRMVSFKSGVITTIAGTGVHGYSGDGGPATSAQLNGACGLAVDVTGNLYIADWANQRIRKVSPSGIITTIAGNGTPGYSGDGGPATSAQVAGPSAIAMDGTGNLFVNELGPSYRVRKISSSGIITTFAGNGSPGHSGDGGLATAAQLNVPTAVAVDGAGNVYIADADCGTTYYCEAAVIRKVSVDGIITTVAGNGTLGYSGDGGSATSAQIDELWGIAADSAGNLYFADAGYHVREVSQNGAITSVAGNGLFPLPPQTPASRRPPLSGRYRPL